jgi:hypothetical protein
LKIPEQGFADRINDKAAQKKELVTTSGFKFEKFLERQRQIKKETLAQEEVEGANNLQTFVDFYDTELKIELHYDEIDFEGVRTASILNYFGVVYTAVL